MLSVLTLLFRSGAVRPPGRSVVHDVAKHARIDLTHFQTSNSSFYTERDLRRFASNAHHVQYQDGQLPRVLVYSYFDIAAQIKPSKAGEPPNPAPWAYRNYCYTHSHGFDLVYSSPHHIKRLEGTEKRGWGGWLPPDIDDSEFFAIWRDVQSYMESDKYDYIYVMLGNMLLNDLYLDFPVWAYDRGHDIIIQDQMSDLGGLILNGVLLRVSSGGRNFIDNVLQYQSPIGLVIQNGQTAFSETILRTIGLEAEAKGRKGYRGECSEFMHLKYLARLKPIYPEQVTSYNDCFFSELERLAGAYGYRDTKVIGFVKTYLWRDNKAVTFSAVRGEGSLLPLPNCLHFFQVLPHWQEDCFASYLNNPSVVSLSQALPPKCPDPSANWASYYGGNDLLWFRRWPLQLQSKFKKRAPRVLIYTWATENSFRMFTNEAHWKHCYAHAHGYDIVFSGHLNVSGVKKLPRAVTDDFTSAWYSDDMMWAWNRDVKTYLFSGKYDYVFHVGADVLFLPSFLDFPVWAWDQGHDITIMDQNYVSYGYNQNAVLLKPTGFTSDYLDLHYGYRRNFWLQGDNGPWMEVMLVYAGQEAEAAGRPGYANTCAEHGMLTMPSWMLLKENLTAAIVNSTRYSTCFFRELDRLVGQMGSRASKHIGWSKTNRSTQSQDKFPKDNDLLDPAPLVAPWANCFTWVRDTWTDYQQNCFAYHWNGAKVAKSKAVVTGTCPDPTFDWKSSPYNYLNREKSAK